MKLYYFVDPCGNFGDDLNPWIWERLLPGFFDRDPNVLFIGIGTLLNHRVPPAAKRVVFGSGVGYGNPIIKDKTWDFICVRGPWSVKQLGIESDLGVIDPAIFINKLYTHGNVARCEVSFMPAGISASRGLWREVCQIAGMQYIDPRDDVESIMKRLDKTRLLITEAMHGAIAAEAFRIPWISVHSGNHMNHNKWQDFCGSLNLIHSPYQLPITYRGNSELGFATNWKTATKKLLSNLWPNKQMQPKLKKSTNVRLEQAAEKLIKISSSLEPVLSDDAFFNNRLEKLFDLLDKVKTKYSQ